MLAKPQAHAAQPRHRYGAERNRWPTHPARHALRAELESRGRGLLATPSVLAAGAADSFAQLGTGSGTVTPGTITTVAGTGEFPLAGGGPVSKAGFEVFTAVTMDAAGNLYIAEGGNQRVRRVGPNGINLRPGLTVKS